MKVLIVKKTKELFDETERREAILMIKAIPRDKIGSDELNKIIKLYAKERSLTMYEIETKIKPDDITTNEISEEFPLSPRFREIAYHQLVYDIYSRIKYFKNDEPSTIEDYECEYECEDLEGERGVEREGGVEMREDDLPF